MIILTRKIKRNIMRKQKEFGYQKQWKSYTKDRKNILELQGVKGISIAMIKQELNKIDKEYFTEV